LATVNCANYASALADVVASAAYIEARGTFYTDYVSAYEEMTGWPNISETTFD